MALIDKEVLKAQLNNSICGYCDDCGDNCERCKISVVFETLEALPECKMCEWNRITRRPMDAEERELWEAEIMGKIADEDAYIYENLPEEGEEVLVCTQYGRVFIDTMCRDEGCYFEDYGEMDGIVAWRPLPEPYKEVDE